MMASADIAEFKPRWHAMWHELGIPLQQDALLETLIQCYSEPHRYYHTMQHLGECLAQLDAARESTALVASFAEIEYALWFHDAVYEVRQQDNELKSAAWACDVLYEGEAPPHMITRMDALVMATRHDALPTSDDERLLVDIDLSILGASTTRFAQYETQVRAEYAWVPEATYRSKRTEILQTFLDRDCIYTTACFNERLEKQARANLTRSIASLRRSP